MRSRSFNLETKGNPIVLVRQVAVADLPQEVQAEAKGEAWLYALHREDGAPVALVKDRATAFFLARENDLTPMSVH